METIPDTALVVRGGLNLPEKVQQGIKGHPSGVVGASVECADGLTIYELVQPLPHKHVGVTTVAEIRTAGGDVVRTAGGSLNHATVTGLSAAVLSWLLNPPIANPKFRRKDN